MTRTVSRSPVTLPLSLTPEQAAAIAVALAAQPDGAYAAEGRAALEKVLEALEPDPRRRAQLLASSLWVSAEAEHAEAIRSVLEQAVTRRRVLHVRYRDAEGQASRRKVEPQLLVRSSDHWFLVAWCRERQALRWFRADRIEEAEPTEESAPRRDLTGVGAPPWANHPAGRALPKKAPAAPKPPRLVVLRGGQA
jgi:predicted DNA-binding transcriptional regulator YafY